MDQQTAQSGQTPLIRIENLGRTYRLGDTTIDALRSVDLMVQANEYLAIMGPSGSGKTTALNMIGALDKPTSGRVLLEGRDLSTLSRRALSHIRRDRIGFVFQAYNLMPVLTAYENAEIVLSLQGVPDDERRERVMALLSEVGLGGLEDRRPDELSGGQQQRVAIARAMAMEPSLMLLDEPTSSLDPELVAEVLDVMRTMVLDGTTMIVVTHEMGFAKTIADRVIFMDEGDIVEENEPNEFFNNPQHDRTRLFLSQIL